MNRPEALRARDAWAEQAWRSELRAPERLVALTYADHARDGLGRVFVTVERLVARTGLSRSSVMRAMASLRQQGWLVPVEPARQHRAPRYALRLPGSREVGTEHQGSQSGTSEGSVVDTPEPPRGVNEIISGATVATKRPNRTPDLSSDLSPHLPAYPGEAASSPQIPAGSGEGGTGGDPRRSSVERAALDAGVDAELIDRIVALALADPSTHSPAGRMSRDAGWRGRLVDRVHGERRDAHRADATAVERSRLCREIARHGAAGDRALSEARYAQGRTSNDESLPVLRQAIHDLAGAARAPARQTPVTPSRADVLTMRGRR